MPGSAAAEPGAQLQCRAPNCSAGCPTAVLGAQLQCRVPNCSAGRPAAGHSHTWLARLAGVQVGKTQQGVLQCKAWQAVFVQLAGTLGTEDCHACRHHNSTSAQLRGRLQSFPVRIKPEQPASAAMSPACPHRLYGGWLVPPGLNYPAGALNPRPGRTLSFTHCFFLTDL